MPHDLIVPMAGLALIQLVASHTCLSLRLTWCGMRGGPVPGMRHRQLMAVEAELVRVANRAVTPKYGKLPVRLREALRPMRRRPRSLMALIAVLLRMTSGAITLTKLPAVDGHPVRRMRHGERMALHAG